VKRKVLPSCTSIYSNVLVAHVYGTRLRYLENAYEILDDGPVIIVEFVPSQLQTFVGGNFVNCNPVREHKLQHVVCGVPACHDIMGDEPFLETELTADAAPSGESDCG
jgi:hypothetical protein